MKAKYNIQEAINLRGKTIDELGFFDIQYMHPDTAKQVVGFQQSIEITSNEHYGLDIPLHVDVLGANRYAYNKIDRDKWYRAYRAWRIYMRQSRPSELISL